MRAWRTPLLIFVAVLATFVWLAVPPALLPGRGSDDPPLGDSFWHRVLLQTYYLSFGCGIVCGTALALAIALRSKRSAS